MVGKENRSTYPLGEMMLGSPPMVGPWLEMPPADRVLMLRRTVANLGEYGSSLRCNLQMAGLTKADIDRLNKWQTVRPRKERARATRSGGASDAKQLSEGSLVPLASMVELYAALAADDGVGGEFAAVADRLLGAILANVSWSLYIRRFDNENGM